MSAVAASAPGSTMIIGEHAVVYGHPALVAAVDQRVRVQIAALEAPTLVVRSEIAEPARYPMDALPPDGPYRFVTAAVAAHRGQIAGGLEISVASEIDPTLGLGSSAAVTIATLGGLARMLGDGLDDVHRRALSIVRKIQGRGSGADLAASLTGGCVAYRAPSADTPARIDTVPPPPALSLCYSGYKTPTGEVLARVATAFDGRADAADAIYAEMGRTASEMIRRAHSGAWADVGPMLVAYQGLMARLGVSDTTLEGIIARTEGTPGLIGCKISGSGLGDCVLALGARPEGFSPAPLATEGLRFDD